MTTLPAPSYRHELDGLRAIAVLAVLGYHAGPNDFPGGFMGVDVFLVLSGYLICQQITAHLTNNRFALGRFWLRRARRLMPAMVPVLGFTLAAALLLNGQGMFEEFSRHFISAGFFYSNYQFASEAGYFARASNTNPLLHTWSLSLEWQFYLIMPLILMALHRFGRAVMLMALFALAAASLIFAETLIRAGNTTWAFYAVTPRFWEFAAGGIVALLSPFLARVAYSGALMRAAGLSLILWSFFGYAGGSFPGLGALVPVFGTMLILLAPIQAKDPVRWLLELRLMQWVGLRSYAIYLVHWPVLVTFNPSVMNDTESLLLSLLLGHLIYRYVEKPVRSGARWRESRAILTFGAATLATIAVIGVLISSPLVVPLRRMLPLNDVRAAITDLDVARAEYSEVLDQIAANTMPGAAYCSFDTLTSSADMIACLTDPAIPENVVLLIGDSHGRDVLAALVGAYPDQMFVLMHQSACVPASYSRGRSLCFDDLDIVLQAVADAGRLNRIILAARWRQAEHLHADTTVNLLGILGADTLIIGPGPTFDDPMEIFALEAGLSGTGLRDLAGIGPDRFAFDVAQVSTDLQAMATATNTRYLDRYALFCPDDLCAIFDVDTGPFLYFDSQHLSPAGLSRFAQMLAGDAMLSGFLNAP